MQFYHPIFRLRKVRRKVKRFCLTCGFCLYVMANVVGVAMIGSTLGQTGAPVCTPHTIMMTNVTPDIHC